MQTLTLDSSIQSNTYDLIQARLTELSQGDELMIQSDKDCDLVLEKLQESEFNTLRWHSKTTSDGQWLARVRIMSSDQCCGGCCEE